MSGNELIINQLQYYIITIGLMHPRDHETLLSLWPPIGVKHKRSIRPILTKCELINQSLVELWCRQELTVQPLHCELKVRESNNQAL